MYCSLCSMFGVLHCTYRVKGGGIGLFTVDGTRLSARLSFLHMHVSRTTLGEKMSPRLK